MKQIFSHNGKIKPLSEAIIPADRIESMYGFGVYETLKVRNHIVYFVKEHIERLFHSADCIDLIHEYTRSDIESALTELLAEVDADSLNIKILLIGGPDATDAQFFIFPLAPLYPKKSWYRDGVTVCSYVYERWMPQSKSLNMLPSYYYYTQAKREGHYDALFVDTNLCVREGTRTNFYVMKGSHICSPPKEDVLEGVTMKTIERAIRTSDFSITYKKIPYTSLSTYDSAFLSSTSSKILPIRTIDGKEFRISPELQKLIELYNQALERSGGDLRRI